MCSRIIAFLMLVISYVTPTLTFADGIEEVVTAKYGVPYCTAEGQTLYLDYIAPKRPAGKKLPAIVFIHGGGWEYGTRADVLANMKTAALRGYFAIGVDYRLISTPTDLRMPQPDLIQYYQVGAPFVAPIQDVKCSVRWLRANASSLGVDENRVGAVGFSAGAHLALMLALTPGLFEGEGGYAGFSSRVSVVADWYGPTELATLLKTTKMPADQVALMEQALDEGYDRLKYSPLTHVSPYAPPSIS